MAKINVMDKEIRFYNVNEDDFISLTDIAKHKNPDTPADIVKNWLRNKNTIALLGLWEKLHNPDFKLVEFDQFRNEAGFNHFVLSPKQWRESHPKDKGNIRDHANVSQLVCLSNLENLNALFIQEEVLQPERLKKLNRIAIQQMQLLMNEVNILGDGRA